jgi:O-antigen/teichoic acid export membrane protein
MHTGKVLLQSMLWRGLYYLSAFIINILLARHFQASLSGAIFFISSIYALVLLLASLSLESGITYFTAKKEIPAARLLNFSLAWSLAVALVTYFIVSVFFYEAYRQVPASLLLLSAVCFITGNLLITYCSGFFYADNNFRTPNIIIVSGTVLSILLIPYNGRSIIPAVSNENYFYIYFSVFLAQGIAMAVAAGFKYVKHWSFSLPGADQLGKLFRYCLMAFTGNLVFFLLYRVDYLFVEKYCTATQLGNYIQVSKLVHLFFILPTILASAVFPITAGAQKENVHSLLALLSRLIFLLYSAACILLALTGKWLFPVVFGESFTEMYQPFLWLIPGILALSGLFTITAYFAGKNRIKLNIYGALIALVVILAGDMLFIPRYGLIAAAMVSSVGYIVYQVYIISAFRKEAGIPVADFFIFKRSDGKKIAASIKTAFN